MNNLPAEIESDIELDVLEHIKRSPNGLRQRDLATVVGKSLGMTNAILHRLTGKGFLMVRKINNRRISYVVTSHGIRELASRSYRYFKRTIRNVVDYKDAIEQEIQRFLLEPVGARPGEAGRQLILVGQSDLEFIIEHLAYKHGLGWIALSADAESVARLPGFPRGSLIVWSEEIDPADVPAITTPSIALRSIVGKGVA